MSDLGLALMHTRYTNKAFWRSSASAFFTFAFPLMFLVIFTVLFGNDTTCLRSLGATRCAPGAEVSTSTFYVASISAFSVITACYTNIAIGLSFSRDSGVLKRLRGTPQPGWTYLFGRILHAVLIAVLLVAICAVFGRAFYHARLPLSSLGPFLLTLVVGAAAFCALGIAITAVIPNADASPAIVNASILPLLFISDVFIPLDNPPAWLDVTSKIFPVKHFVAGLLASYFPAPGQSPVRVGDLLVVGAWGLVGVILAVRFFSWEPRR